MTTTSIKQNKDGTWPKKTVKKESGTILLKPAAGKTLKSAAPEADVGLTAKGKDPGNSANLKVGYDYKIGTATSGWIDVIYSSSGKDLTDSSSRAMLTLGR